MHDLVRCFNCFFQIYNGVKVTIYCTKFEFDVTLMSKTYEKIGVYELKSDKYSSNFFYCNGNNIKISNNYCYGNINSHYEWKKQGLITSRAGKELNINYYYINSSFLKFLLQQNLYI